MKAHKNIKRYGSIVIMIGAMVTAFTLSASAAVPPTINYQGMLRTNAGQPVNDSVQMRFCLYSSGTGTPALWTETQSSVVVTNGRYQVTLGSITPITLPFDQQYYLGITVGADPELSPRTALTTVPYALKATSAESVATSGAIVSTVPTGTAPFQVSSTTMVPNLNADTVDSKHSTDLVLKAGDTMTGTLTVPALVSSGTATLGGNIILPTTTSSSGAIRSGPNTLIHVYGSGNFFAGPNAGNFTTGAINNTAVGSAALASSTTGSYNTAVGHSALAANTTGFRNVAVGENALTANIGGYGNTSVGSYSLFTNTSGYGNVALGINALRLNTSGYSNSAIGDAALYSNATGSNNTALGRYAGYNQTTGSNNIYLGANVLGVAGESNVTRIGSGQTQAYIAGIVNAGGLASSGTATVNGNLALPATSTTAGVIWQGANTLMHSYGPYNFFAGSRAGNLTMSGGWNTACGQGTLVSNTTGHSNAANGYAALGGNTTGYQNTASGYAALTSNTTGFDNTASGYSALFSNTSGAFNTATGYLALYSSATGNYNTAFGAFTLYSNTTGSLNTATGGQALYDNTTGYYNTATGAEALRFNTTGYENTAHGLAALRANGTGFGNTAIGTSALSSNTAGTYNTACGRYALYNARGHSNTALGVNSLYNNSTGDFNTASGMYALNANTTGNNNTGIGYGADVSPGTISNATAIGSGAVVTASNYVRIGNTAVTHIGGQVGFSNDSDVREKKDIEDITYGLSFIKQLRPVQYKLKQGNDHIDFGFIAQEVEFLLGTNYNVLGIGGDADRMLSLRYTDFIAPLVRAVQEQQEVIEQQQTLIGELKKLVCIDHVDAVICHQ